jgi:hypothetical protein
MELTKKKVDAIQKVADEVRDEVVRASLIHSPMASAHEAYAVTLEELDEFWDEVKKNPKKMTEEERGIWRKKLRTEAVQTSAMCQRFIVDLMEDTAEES